MAVPFPAGEFGRTFGVPRTGRGPGGPVRHADGVNGVAFMKWGSHDSSGEEMGRNWNQLGNSTIKICRADVFFSRNYQNMWGNKVLKISDDTVDGRNPSPVDRWITLTIYRVSTILFGGAGFLPSTVPLKWGNQLDEWSTMENLRFNQENCRRKQGLVSHRKW